MEIVAARLPIYIINKDVNIPALAPGIYYYTNELSVPHNYVFEELTKILQSSINELQVPAGQVRGVVSFDTLKLDSETLASLFELGINPICSQDGRNVILGQHFIDLDNKIGLIIEDGQLTQSFLKFAEYFEAVVKNNPLDLLVRRLYKNKYENRILTKINRYLDSEELASS